MRVMNREVSLAVGERLASQPDVAESFWPGDILAMSEYHRELARAGDPRTALMLQRLLYAAIEGNPGGPRMAIGSDFVHQMWTVVGADLLKIIHYEITRLPDGRLLRLACQAGDTVLPHARQAIGAEPAGLLMREIGTLHLDPYLDPRGPKGQPLDDPRQHWLERLRDERGDELVSVPVAELEMPTPVDALGTAAHYLRDAIPLLDGHPRGTALKALAQALIVLDHRGENIDRAEFLNTANEAIRLIDPARAPQYIIDLRRWLEQDGWQHAGLEASPDELARRLGRVGARGRVLQWLRTADAAEAPSPWAKADLQSRLGERTVLVQQALARTSDGLMAIATLLLTREEVAFGGICTDINNAWTMLEQDDVRVRLHPAGLLVARVRRDLRERWTPREPVSEAVRTQLDAHSYLGPIGGALKSLRERGKDHLCIVPHGPMHFLPYHLLEVDGRPLADDWIVTYLPSVGLLMRDPAEQGARPGTGTREGAAVFGIGYGSDYPFELPELSESLAEAEAVAAVYGVEPKLDCDATEQAVRHGLEHARVIHLSAHGRHNVAAPGFQTLYLWPTYGDDGRMMAHEIATLDLAGVNLVTLSACETALGRFDFSDNLRGLPATLLLGGASTIVGTLWNVSPEVSTAFFREFHARAAGKGQLLDAFAAGQRAARAIDGHYLEWGAFYLSGGW
jgi:CHAT domain-containing protein